MKRGDPPSWDPDLTPGGARDTRETYHYVFSVLANLGPRSEPCKTEVTPEMAESWRWLGDTTFEIKVRQGVRFQNKPPVNGRELTAEDVAYSMNRAFGVPKRGLGSLPKHVKEIKATDRYTVQVTTDVPQPGIVDLYMASMYGSVVLAKEAGGPNEKWGGPETYIGSGPFTLDEWVPGVKMVYSKNPDYWKKGQPYLDQVVQMIMPDQSTRTAALRSGKLDLWFGEVPVAVAKALEGSQIQIQRCNSFSGPGKMWMRQDMEGTPFADVRVRQAISMAIDREGLLMSALQGQGTVVPLYPPATSPLNMSMEDLPAEIRKYVTYNPQEAKRLLAEAGYPDGFDTTLTVTRRYGSPYIEIAEGLMGQLNDAGIRVKPNWVEYGQWASKSLKGNYEGLMYGYTIFGNPLDELGRYHSGAGFNLNRSHLNDPTLDSLIDKLLTTTDPAAQREVAFDIQKRAVEQAYVIDTPAPFDFALYQPWVKNFLWNGGFYWTGVYMDRVWLEK